MIEWTLFLDVFRCMELEIYRYLKMNQIRHWSKFVNSQKNLQSLGIGTKYSSTCSLQKTKERDQTNQICGSSWFLAFAFKCLFFVIIFIFGIYRQPAEIPGRPEFVGGPDRLNGLDGHFKCLSSITIFLLETHESIPGYIDFFFCFFDW